MFLLTSLITDQRSFSKQMEKHVFQMHTNLMFDAEDGCEIGCGLAIILILFINLAFFYSSIDDFLVDLLNFNLVIDWNMFLNAFD